MKTIEIQLDDDTLNNLILSDLKLEYEGITLDNFEHDKKLIKAFEDGILAGVASLVESCKIRRERPNPADGAPRPKNDHEFG